MSTRPRFEKEAKGNSGMAYYVNITLRDITSVNIPTAKSSKMAWVI